MVIDDKDEQRSIEMDGNINGKEGRFLFDTGAGGNLITPELAKEYGLRPLDTDITVGGICIWKLFHRRNYGIYHRKYQYSLLLTWIYSYINSDSSISTPIRLPYPPVAGLFEKEI